MAESKDLIDLLHKLDPSFARDLSGLNRSFDGVVANPRGLSQLDLLPLVLEGTDAVLAGRSTFSKEISPFASYINESRTKFCNGHESHRDTDAHIKLFIHELRAVIAPSIKGSKSVARSKQLSQASVLIFTGVPSPSALRSLYFKFKPSMICCLYAELSSWLPWLDCKEISELFKSFISDNIAFRSRKSSRYIQDLFSLVRSELLGFVGDIILVNADGNLSREELRSAFSQRFFPTLRAITGGPCIDEFFMISHTQQNLLDRRSSFYSKSVDRCVETCVVVASGASLDFSVDVIRRLASSSCIVAAGSSIGSLWREGIVPDFHVHVERGGDGGAKSQYEKLLIESGDITFGNTICVAPSSIEPDILRLYDKSLLYARSGQSPINFWPSLQSSTLPYEGPQSLSAAFSFAVNLRPISIILIGCDLGALDNSKRRSLRAISSKPEKRSFSLEVKGNFQEKAFTSPEMLVQLRYMNASLSASSAQPQVLNMSEGIHIPFAKPLMPSELNSLVLSTVEKSDELYFRFCSRSVDGVVSPFPAKLDKLSFDSSSSWFAAWLSLADNAVRNGPFWTRMNASYLLNSDNCIEFMPVYKVFRGTLRDAIWLVAHAVQFYCFSNSEVEECWFACSRFIRSLMLESCALEARLSDGLSSERSFD
tara:strand:+ start:1022 stop:2980 length:1959 start_codon:yes stop_codon:yes gene_type:complete